MTIREDVYILAFIGSKYELKDIDTVGKLRDILCIIATELPNNDDLRLETIVDKGVLEYILEHPILTGDIQTNKKYVQDEYLETEGTIYDVERTHR